MPGPPVRTDIVEVYVFRRPDRHPVEFLQMRRKREPMAGTWQPVMGHVEGDETAVATARRELAEETGFQVAQSRGFWQLESLDSYYLASLDEVVLSPGFAVEVAPDAEPVIDDAHDAHRWVPRDRTDRAFYWPGQRQQAVHIVSDLLDPSSELGERLRLSKDD
ncbi:MAG: NUDIX domain-containing protein [Phycisphaeraceae bacterium]|nr:NUDIX domain-containing protein [Phycisphaeraceae bacterium]